MQTSGGRGHAGRWGPGALVGALAGRDDEDFLEHTVDLPPDGFRPEGVPFERVEWFQRCVEEMWPYLSQWLVGLLRGDVERRLQAPQTGGICTRRASNLYWARSRLYRSRFLRLNIHLKALAEI